ncbi:MAG TPA: penicillin-binding protein 1A [Steroidobacteraceae bacterium]
MNRTYLRLFGYAAASVILVTLLIGYAFVCAFIYLAPSLPSAEAMRRVELRVPLRVYSRSGQLIAQIGEQRRIPVAFRQIPEIVKNAFIAAEDDRFFSHHGIDYAGVVRAILVDVISGDRAQGASTITMQAARNMFLTQEKTVRRKLQEVFLTYRMEHEFSKQEILGLYLNVIYFGQRSYGVAAAAEAYFGKSLDQLTVAEAATLAGVPKAPSRYNPLVNPDLAQGRRGYVLRRMRELSFIDPATAELANHEPLRARVHSTLFDVDAPYVAEMARLEVHRRFGADGENAGYKVYTTIDSRLQAAANRALRLGLVEYDRRHGWRGAQAKVSLEANATPEQLEDLLDEYPTVGNLSPGIVVSLAEKSARVYVKTRGFAQLDWSGLSWARTLNAQSQQLGPEPKSASEVFERGDVVYVLPGDHGAAQLAQVPDAQAALVALDANDGAIAALVGGFDYFANKYNRVTQARRQPGSSFKPFLYSAALEDGFTPASVIMDAPVVVDDPGMEGTWRPENYSREFSGPTRLREALVRSRNLVSIRILRQMGLQFPTDYVQKFGFQKSVLPQNLTLALGTLQATPLELATGYATFANGGYHVQPYYIDRIDSPSGEVVYRAAPKVVCEECAAPDTVIDPSIAADAPPALRAAASVRGGVALLPPEKVAERVISPQNAYLMDDMMHDVITRGTGRGALVLNRSDIAGKTGTTNEARDTWFNGFTRNLVATVWVGYDQERSLGEREEGSRTAVPVWVYFMREALRHVPEQHRTMPDGLVQMRISPDTGALASAEDPGAIVETFMTDKVPSANGPESGQGGTSATSDTSGGGEPIF